jgi:hypothetical protein
MLRLLLPSSLSPFRAPRARRGTSEHASLRGYSDDKTESVRAFAGKLERFDSVLRLLRALRTSPAERPTA